MLLVRHTISRAPFHDYNALSLRDIDNIAMRALDPHIQPFKKEDVCEELERMLRSGHPVRCSPSVRTRETYAVACSVLGVEERPPVLDPRLREIWFRPSGFVRENERPLDAIRERLYGLVLDGSPHTEPADELLARVNDVLDDPDLRNAVCFTHGFLMRFIKAYVEADRNRESLRAALEHSPPIDYLGCFRAP